MSLHGTVYVMITTCAQNVDHFFTDATDRESSKCEHQPSRWTCSDADGFESIIDPNDNTVNAGCLKSV